MTTRLARLFTSHPAKVGETYFSHMAFAAWFCSRLFMAAFAALIHAFLPFLFETTASRIVRELYERLARAILERVYFDLRVRLKLKRSESDTGHSHRLYLPAVPL